MSSESSDLAMSVRGLSKAYQIGADQGRFSSLREKLMARVHDPLGRQHTEQFWALRDVSFEIKRGEVVGIIGRNGAGKSTLLKLLSRITVPTAGEVDLYGRVGSLLEVGTGFHPELTGRENIFLNGSILGMRRAEIRAQFDEIVEFSGVAKFLDTPVKRYSSGMYVRLAFAVAAHLQPEILIIDEVLSVGDAEFQRKCLGKMQGVAASGRTVLFVSHHLAMVRQLCQRAILLRAGTLVAEGPAAEIVNSYMAVRDTGEAIGQVSAHGLALTECALVEADGRLRTDMPVFNGNYRLQIVLTACEPFPRAAVNIKIHDEWQNLVSTVSTVEEGLGWFDIIKPTRIVFELPRLQLLPGRYTVTVHVQRANDFTKFLEADAAYSFEVQPAVVRDAAWAYRRGHGVVRISDGAVLESLAETESKSSAAGARI